MFPAEFPRELAKDPSRSAERKVFQALQAKLSSEFICFYSRPWWGLDSTGAEKNGEADFVVVEKDLGVIFLEVKGGRVSYDPEKDAWLSIDRHNFARPIKDPVDQAKACQYKFLGMFKNDQIWPKGTVKITYGAILPDTKAPPPSKQVIGKHPRELFLFGDSFPEDLELWLTERLSPGGTEIPPGAAGVQVLKRVIADPTKLSFPLRSVIDGENEDMDQYLIGVQHHVINSVLREEKSVVSGGAGTGKTVVAMELCVRLARMGKTVVFTTKSKNLASFAEKVIQLDEVSVRQWSPSNGLGNSEFDALIIDEGQDFDHSELRAIAQLSEGRQLAVFLDSNQAIVNDPHQIADRLDAKEFFLNINLRNTRAICRVTERLFEGELPEPVGPEGASPEFHIADQDLAEAVAEVILKAVKSGLRISQAAVLTDSVLLRDEIIKVLADSALPSGRLLDWKPDCILVETIEDFKGLESDFLVVALTQPHLNTVHHAYVAASRARSRLVVISSSMYGSLVQALQSSLSQS